MKKYILSTYIVIALATLLFALPVAATEPIQPLLAELTRPNAPMLEANEAPALVSADDQATAGSGNTAPVAALFSLEELRNSTDDESDIELPDVEMPVSDIPLTLNSNVEYFLYYFQTNGKPSFSRWLSHSSRYIPMMKEILKREGMPEDLVYVAMIESGFKMHARSWA
ncbi:MAG: lytic transglycosylase, partial [Desulfuromonadaceae bacterium]